MVDVREGRIRGRRARRVVRCGPEGKTSVKKIIRPVNKIVVPTLAHRSDRAIEIRRRIGTPEFVLQKMKQIQPHTKESFQRMHQAGIKMAMGTDTGLDPDMGANAYELAIYVSYGMTPMEGVATSECR